MPKVWKNNLFDDFFDDYDLMDREMEQLNRKLYGVMMKKRRKTERSSVRRDIPV